MRRKHDAQAGEALYPEQVSVALTGEQHVALKAYAYTAGMGIGAVMRQALLAEMGTKGEGLNLHNDDTAREPGEHLHREARPPAIDGTHGARATVKLSRAQKAEMLEYAAKKGVALSALLRTAGLVDADRNALDSAPADPDQPRRGRPPGSAKRVEPRP